MQLAEDPLEADGINTRVELAAVTARLRDRINTEHMLAGVTIVDPASTWIDAGVEIEPDVDDPSLHRHPRRGAYRERRRDRPVRLDPHAHRARPRTRRSAPSSSSRRRASARGTKIPHLSYIGDAEIGEGTNVAAGNVTANFSHIPGQPKKRTTIGSNVRTGVDNTFLAPVEIGDDTWIAPGTVITENVPPGSLAGFAPRQTTKEGWVYEKHGNPDGD